MPVLIKPHYMYRVFFLMLTGFHLGFYLGGKLKMVGVVLYNVPVVAILRFALYTYNFVHPFVLYVNKCDSCFAV